MPNTDTNARGWANPIPYGTAEETSVVLDWASHDDFGSWDLAACGPIQDWPPDARMSCTELEGERKPDDVVPNHLGLIVVSQKCRDVMLSVPGASDCVQFLPCRLDYRGMNLGTYYVVNVIASVAAFDGERSRFDVYTSLDGSVQPVGSVKSIRHLVLLPGRLKAEVPVFRLREKLTWVIFSPSLRGALDSAGVTGFEWWEVALSSDPGYTE
jgi:hypothetical protein